MKLPLFLSKRFRFVVPIFLAGIVSLQGAETAWTGAGGDGKWFNSKNWSNGVPNNQGEAGYTATIDVGTTHFGTTSDLPVTIDNLTLYSGEHVFSKNLTVLGSTDLGKDVPYGYEYSLRVSSTTETVKADLGNLVDFSDGELRQGRLWVFAGKAPAIVEWRGANVTMLSERTFIFLQGQESFVRDSLTGKDALAGLLENRGSLYIEKRAFTLPGGFSNKGNLGTNFNASLAIDGNFDNSKDFHALDSRIEVHGTASNSGKFSISQRATAFIGDSTATSDFMNDGVLEIAGNLVVEAGNLILGQNSKIAFNLTILDPEAGKAMVGGQVSLDGELSISMWSSKPSDLFGKSFVMLEAESIVGSFDNVSSGGRISVSQGSFLVTIGKSEIVLSNFQVVPESETWVLLGCGVLFVLGVTRRI